MKQHSASTPDPEDFVSDFSVSFVDNIASNDASTLEQALIFLKGTLQAKEEELTRLHEEKEKAVESKFELMMENKLLVAKLERVGMDSKNIHVDWEKETTTIESRIELMVDKIGSKKELAEMLKLLFQAQKEKEAALESKVDLLVKELKDSKNQNQEKEEGTEDVQQSKEAVEQTTNVMQSHEETELIEEMKMLTRVMSEKEESFRREISERKESFKKEISEKEESFKREISEKEEYFRKDMQKSRNRGKELSKKLLAAIESSKTRTTELEMVLDQFTKSLKFDQFTKSLKFDQFTKSMQLFVWKKSGTKVAFNNSSEIEVDALSCNPLKAGTLEWKVCVKEKCDYLRLGVISSMKDVPLNPWLGNCKKSWGYTYGGYSINDKKTFKNNHPKFTIGSVVHFVLDLTGNGTVCVSVNGSSLVEIFSNMKSSLDEDEGFLPAVSLAHGAKVELCPV